MVMEAPPSPQSVGREFVRQYYTLLNKAPTHLHRFYNHQSSFVHGGLDPPNRETTPVIGQKQIHQKIQQLNFRDCHAKITQVDSQATLGNGVVVQVTGELSNAGQPMRRFTQTFVLAAQSPKKYYVHNDIFRYQDEIISDEECDADTHSDVEEDVIGDRQQLMPSDVQPQPPSMAQQPAGVPPYYNPAAAAAPAGQIQPNIPPQVAPLHHGGPPAPLVLSAAQLPPVVAAVNGAMHPEDIGIIQGQIPPHVSAAPTAQPAGLVNPVPSMQQPVGLVQAPLNPPLTPVEPEQPQMVDEEPVEEQQLDNSFGEQQEFEQEQVMPMESASNEPKTYANLLKSGNSAMPPYGSPPSQAMPQMQSMRPMSPPPGGMNQGLGPRVGMNNTGGQQRSGGGVRLNQQQPARIPNRPDGGRNQMGGGGGVRNSINEEGSYEDKRRRPSQSYSDINQLFLGNIPHMASEDELREIFGEFGNVVELRILSKQGGKVGGPPGMRAPPNYGFITYESQSEVQYCLSQPIYYPKGDKGGTLLNVEEKKIRDRPSYGGGGASQHGQQPRQR